MAASTSQVTVSTYQPTKYPTSVTHKGQVVLKKLTRDLPKTYHLITQRYYARIIREQERERQYAFSVYQQKRSFWGTRNILLNARGKPARGAYGEVYWTNQPRVIVKVSKTTSRDEAACARTEIAVLRMLTKDRAPHSVRQLDSAQFLSEEFCSFQWYAGYTLLEMHIDPESPFMKPATMYEVESIAKQLLEYLAFLASRNRVHGDLKPSNASKDAYGSVRAFDLGLSKIVPAKTWLLYSRWYRAPEAILDMQIDVSADIWALGCILHEIYTGNPLLRVNDEGSDYLADLKLLHRQLQRLGIPNENLEDVLPQNMIEAMRCNNFIRENEKMLRPLNINHWRTFGSAILSVKESLISPGNKVGQLIDLISRMLKMNPRDRIRAADALQHPFFTAENTDVSFSPRIVGDTTNLFLRVTNYQGHVVQQVALKDAEPCYHLRKSQQPFLFQIYHLSRPLDLSINPVVIQHHTIYNIDTRTLRFSKSRVPRLPPINGHRPPPSSEKEQKSNKLPPFHPKPQLVFKKSEPEKFSLPPLEAQKPTKSKRSRRNRKKAITQRQS